ncbi:MAG TPA: hypothetical protein VH372_22495 [Actinospica sp.]|nr:hypothetical protein [Actinospica sp.]
MGDGRSRSALWRRCRHIVERLDLPRPFDAREFIGLLALERGRPIELIQVAARPNLPCGLMVSTDDADLILYSADTSALHRQHILLHEAAHLVCGHCDGAFAGDRPAAEAGTGTAAAAGARTSGGTAVTPGAADETGAAAASFGAIEAMLSHLPAELVHRVLGRTVYSEPQEREAELVASLILYRIGRNDGRPARLPHPPSRLEAVFGLSES